VVAVVDWELAHLGDPMDDIAWLSLRAVQEPFTTLSDRVAEYEALSGHTVDQGRVAYYRVMAETKLQVMRHRAEDERKATEGGGGDVGNGLIYNVLHDRLWLEALADVLGLERPAPEAPPPQERTDEDWLFDVVLGQLRDVVVPRITDPLAAQRGKGLARILKYLAESHRHGVFYAACELDDLTRLLGAGPASLEEGRAAVAAAAGSGMVEPRDYLRYRWARIARENELWRSASGVLADRHWAPVK
jgi:hypothetical protein